MRGHSFEQCQAEACVVRMVKAGGVSILVIVHVDGIFAMWLKGRRETFCRDLNLLVPVNNLGESLW